MAAKRRLGCLGTLLIILVILAVAVIVVLNLTFAQLGIDKIVVDKAEGTTLADLGFSDVKLKDVIVALQKLRADDDKLRTDLAENPIDAENGVRDSDEVFSSDSNPRPDYSNVATEQLTTPTPQEAALSDSTVGYILSKGADSLISSSDFGSSDVKVISFKLRGETGTNKVTSTVVVEVSKDKLLTALGEPIQSVASKLIKGDSIFLTVTSTLNLNTTDKKLEPTTEKATYKVNGSDELTNLLQKAIDAAMEEGEDPIGGLLEGLDQSLCTAINNIGKVNSVTPEGVVNITTHTAP